MVTALSITALILSLGGNLLINFRKRAGYLVWIFSNLFWVAINFIDHLNVSQVCMYLIYTGLNIQGFIMWSRKNNKEAKNR